MTTNNSSSLKDCVGTIKIKKWYMYTIMLQNFAYFPNQNIHALKKYIYIAFHYVYYIFSTLVLNGAYFNLTFEH